MNPLADNSFAEGQDQNRLMHARSGDRKALEDLLERHQGWIFNIALRMLYHPQDAEDATQEILVKILTRLSSFEGRSSFRTWLYRIAVNHCLNRLRRRSLVRFFSLSRDEEEPAVDPPDPAPDPERSLDAARRWRAAKERIERLPANQRAVLVLAKFEGLSYREIAAILSITESAVESRLVRAMRTLVRAQGSELSAVSDKGVKG